MCTFSSAYTTFTGDKSKASVLPCLTACPLEAFKKRGFFYNEEDYTKWTFELDEIFILKGVNYDLGLILQHFLCKNWSLKQIPNTEKSSVWPDG